MGGMAFVAVLAVFLLMSSPTSAELPKGSLHGHMTYAEVNAWVLRDVVQKFPQYATYTEFGRSFEHRPMNVLCLGEQCLKPNTEHGGDVLFTALHHAREPLGLMAIAAFVDDILNRTWNLDFNTKHLLRRRRMFFVFVVNPDGYVKNEGASGMRRKNTHYYPTDKCPLTSNTGDGEVGVDLNRNYDICFDQDKIGSSTNPCAVDYRGPFAFSEPETQAMKLLVNGGAFSVAFNYHSFGKKVYIPYGCKAKGPTDDKFFDLYAARLTSSNGYEYGQPWAKGLYSVNGDAADWMYSEKGIYAVSPEVAPADPVPDEKSGFWIDESQVPKLAKETLQMNYLGAWTAGAYFEVELVEPSAEPDTLMFRLRNFGLAEHAGWLYGAIKINSITTRLLDRGILPKGLSMKAETYVDMVIPFKNDDVDNATLVVKDDLDCVIYLLTNKPKRQLTLMHRVGLKDEPCLTASSDIPKWTEPPFSEYVDKTFDGTKVGPHMGNDGEDNPVDSKSSSPLVVIGIVTSVAGAVVILFVMYRAVRRRQYKFHKVAQQESELYDINDDDSVFDAEIGIGKTKKDEVDAEVELPKIKKNLKSVIADPEEAIEDSKSEPQGSSESEHSSAEDDKADDQESVDERV